MGGDLYRQFISCLWALAGHGRASGDGCAAWSSSPVPGVGGAWNRRSPTDGRKALRSHSHLCSELSIPQELGKQATFSFSPWHQQSISTSCFPVCSCKMTWFEWFFTQVTHSTDVFSVCVDRDLEPVLHGAILVSAISPVIFMHKLLTLRIIYILITDSQPPLGESSDLFTSSWQASEGFLTQACWAIEPK